MGLLDDIKSALGGQPGDSSNILAKALEGVGGYQGVVAMMQQAGLGDRVQSWLSANASNLPVTSDEIKAALGDQRLQQLAAKFGIPVDQVAGLLAQHLPAAVDKASPDGKLPTATA